MGACYIVTTHNLKTSPHSLYSNYLVHFDSLLLQEIMAMPTLVWFIFKANPPVMHMYISKLVQLSGRLWCRQLGLFLEEVRKESLFQLCTISPQQGHKGVKK